MAYTLLVRDNASTVSELQFNVNIYIPVDRDNIAFCLRALSAEQSSSEWNESKIYQLRILSIVRLNERLWRSAVSVYFVIRSVVFHLASISESCNSNV